MEGITYSVALANSSCIFDSAEGFESIEEALDWAKNRGHHYNIQLDMVVDGIEKAYLTLIPKKQGRKTVYVHDYYGNYQEISPEDIESNMHPYDYYGLD